MSSIYDFDAINKGLEKLEDKKRQRKPCWYCNGKGKTPDFSDPLVTLTCHLCGGSGLAEDHPVDVQMRPQTNAPQAGIRPIPIAELMTFKMETLLDGSKMIVVSILGTTDAWGSTPNSPLRIQDFLDWLKQASGRS